MVFKFMGWLIDDSEEQALVQIDFIQQPITL